MRNANAADPVYGRSHINSSGCAAVQEQGEEKAMSRHAYKMQASRNIINMMNGGVMRC
jgi:hypothetical protein